MQPLKPAATMQASISDITKEHILTVKLTEGHPVQDHLVSASHLATRCINTHTFE